MFAIIEGIYINHVQQMLIFDTVTIVKPEQS